MNALNRHPFPVRAFFDRSLVLGFAAPKDQLADRIPACLELDLFEDSFAFIAVALVQTRHLRPAIFPKFLGRDFTLIGYRIFVRYQSASGRRLRGLYILGSETDNPSMKRLGSIFTQYDYQLTPIDWDCDANQHRISTPGGLEISAGAADDDSPLPDGSPFPDWRSARRFAGPMPFTFSYDADERDVVIVEGQRETWKPRPVAIDHWKIPFVEQLAIDHLTLANAFIVENVPYRWKRGRVESWQG